MPTPWPDPDADDADDPDDLDDTENAENAENALYHQATHPEPYRLYRNPRNPDELSDPTDPGELIQESSDDIVGMAVATWQSKLLQLDRRNNLLYFKGNPEQVTPSGRSRSTRCVPIINLNPDEVDEFLNQRRKATFDFVERKSNPRRFDSQLMSDDSDQNDERVIPGKLKTNIEPHTLQSVLQRFLKKDREWEEEQGINVLFLAVGFLHWIDEEGQSVKSPLLLLPCDLERSSPRDAFILRREDDDVAVNATLRHKLQEFTIDLPEFDHDNYTDYLDTVKGLITNRSSWNVSYETILAVFPYTKMAMWEDLQQMRQAGMTHPLVRQLAGEFTNKNLNDNAIISLFPSDNELAGGKLDEIISLRDEYIVTEADHSQLQAVAAARSGRDLVVHGPPGTGKSQTIVNIIANLMAHGKRVLFVSEKSVALNVVKERLEQSGLGTFCLDMHSENGRKSLVYDQLNRSWGEEIPPQDLDVDETLEDCRTKLNEVVRALHELREPFGLSLYQIYGEYGQVRDLPDVEFNVPSLSTFNREHYRQLESVVERIALRPDEFRTLDMPTWKTLKIEASSFGIANDIRRDAREALEAVMRVEEGIQQIADVLEMPRPSNLNQLIHSRDLIYHLEKRPLTLPENWLQIDTIDRLHSLAVSEKDRQAEALRLVDNIERAFAGNAPEIDFHGVLEEINNLDDPKYRVFTSIFKGNWPDRLLPNPAKILTTIATADDAVTEICNALVELSVKLGVESPSASLDETETVLDFIGKILELGVVSEKWTDLDLLADLQRRVELAHETAIKLDHIEEEFFYHYDSEIISDSFVDKEMLGRLRTDHQSKLKRSIGGAYRGDRKRLSRFLKSPKKLEIDDCISIVTCALDIRSLQQNFDEIYALIEEVIYTYANGRKTDWNQVKHRIDEVSSLLRSWPWSLDQLRMLLTSHEHQSALMTTHRKYLKASKKLDDVIAQIASNHVDTKNTSPLDIYNFFHPARLLLESLVEVIHPVIEQFKLVPHQWLKFCGIIRDASRLQTIDSEERDYEAELSHSFNEWFNGRDTDWDSIIGTLEWCRKLLDLVDGSLNGRLQAIACGRVTSFDSSVSSSMIEEFQSRYESELQVLNARFDATRSAWRSWAEAPFEDLKTWLNSINNEADSAENWIELKRLAKNLDDILGLGTVENVRRATNAADQVPGIIKRRLFRVWLDKIESQDPRIRDFSATDHERIRHKFCELDRQLPQILRENVRSILLQNYPTNRNIGTSSNQSGQIGILRRELQKRRRQLSVRRLLHKAPKVIQALKPCFLMSPLGVSQYLERTDGSSQSVYFDTVIFDEASQIKPEDAVPAISRADQVIVVGDQKQLPPSNFFEHSNVSGNDDETDDQTDWLEGQESILDVMVSMAFSSVEEHNLVVHYRSRHDSLIRYSNRHFYEDRLLTFPNPGIDDSLGVRDVYLSDGRYDVGGSRTNQVEAQKVVELVFKLFQTRPNESIGVVALSRNQADRIETLIDEHRLESSQFDGHFSSNNIERFFVKNLENVQGDERDHIILSVGYGPSTESKRVYNRFGPINGEGGERRLNVAVSRARRSMTIVHSLKPGDIVSESAGARLLRRYIEYAMNPETALEQNLTVDAQAETESPFEEEVRRSLIERGHQVDVQVGVAGYRIDLAIKVEDGHGYALGIECDGATYHSAPAARDRDWLRQLVLEGLGWKIHRVWSRSWIQDPERELRRIEEALQGQGRVSSYSLAPQSNSAAAMSSNPTLAENELGRGSLEPTESNERTDLDVEEESLFASYEIACIDDVDCTVDWDSHPRLALKELILPIVKTEGPVHRDVVVERIRVREGMGRVRGSRRDLIYDVMNELVTNDGLLWLSEQSDEGIPYFLTTAERRESIYPRAPHDELRRDIEHISLDELEMGAFACAQTLFGSSFDDLIKYTARCFGFGRSGSNVKSRISRAISGLIEGGRLIGDRNMLTPTDEQ